MFPNGQLCGNAYAVAEGGTQQTINSMSATARFMIRRFVVFRICLLNVTTSTTSRFPKNPTKTIMEKNTGTTIDTIVSIFFIHSISGLGGSSMTVDMSAMSSMLPLINDPFLERRSSEWIKSLVTFILLILVFPNGV